MMNNNLDKLITETRNKQTTNLDAESIEDILEIINNEDRLVAESVQKVLPQIASAIELICKSINNGGRLFYIGAGTSGRTGILDAVECIPTFSTSPELVQGIIAGGDKAIIRAVEGIEDSEVAGAEDLQSRDFTGQDVVIGIAASGRTPYVVGALKYAQKIGAKCVSLSSNPNSLISKYSNVKIEVVTGPEVLTGSTRMKAASAHKMILNMISTTTMIKIGKVYENLMVDLKASNYKLKQRAISIVTTITGVSKKKAAETLELTNYEVKPAIIMIKCKIGFEQAQYYLDKGNGFVRKAIELAENNS